MNALEIKNLTKEYDTFKLDNISFNLPSGCIVGLIGKNGAGKSTTIKLILDMIEKDHGTISILGKDNKENIQSIKEDIGVVLDEAGIPDCLTAKQVGKIMKLTFKQWDEYEYNRLISKFSLSTTKPFKEFSRGTKMKLAIAIAMSHKAKLLILDEPTNALDPVVRDEVIEMLYDFTRDEDHSILISSHIVSDLEKLCDYIVFIDDGKVLLNEEKDVLLSKYGIIHCTEEQLNDIPEDAIKHKRESKYGIELIIERELIGNSYSISPVNIEDLFLLMVKKGDKHERSAS